jgi:hypothetical protein
VQWTYIRSGGVPTRASSLPKDVTKHVACAAASSSSGLVFPSVTSIRAAIVDGSSNDPVLTARTAPDPRAVVPIQSISASRTIRGTYAMTSTRCSSLRSSGVSAASFSITRRSAWIETST